MFKTIPDALTPERAWQKLSACDPLNSVNRKISDALSFCLIQDFRAVEDVPSAPRSFMDGYALRANDVSSVPVTLRIKGEVLMGAVSSLAINNGEAVRIPTGGFLPEGADCVIMQEDVDIHGQEIVVKKALKRFENVQVAGEDYRKGDLIFRAGHILRPQDLAAFATFGQDTINVRARPAIAVYSTGNELVNYSESKLIPGTIRETNSLALQSAAQTFEFKCAVLGIFRDEFEIQRSAMEQALESADVILVSGGSSVGEKDYTLPVIQSFADHKIHFHGLAIRPGNPTIFASIGDKYIFGLPGQPVSSLIVFYLFVLPFLFHLSGESIRYPQFLDSKFASRRVTLKRPVQPLKSKTDYLRLKLLDDGTAEPVTGKSSSLFTLTQADGFAILPPGETPVPGGSFLTAYIFP